MGSFFLRPSPAKSRQGRRPGLTGLLLFVALLLTPSTVAFYLPGVAPNDYRLGDKVELDVNHLTAQASSNTDHRLKSIISYDYYFPPFHFCRPSAEEGGPQSKAESLGAILFGDRIFNSPFDLHFGRNSSCQALCRSVVPAQDAKFINSRIQDNYMLNWLIDGLPDGGQQHAPKTVTIAPSVGIALGRVVNEQTSYFHNHYQIQIHYHPVDDTRNRIVGVTATPSSKQTPADLPLEATDRLCDSVEPQALSESGDTLVTFTYSVEWIPSDITWGTRWDAYLFNMDPQIHWFSLINSMVVVIFLTGMIAMVLVRTLHRDIARYNAMDAQEDLQEDFGWKLVHGDVFRPPAYARLLSILVGNGCQLFYMAVVTLVFASLGFLSPSNRGSLATMMVCFYVLFSCAAGYNTARVYKMLNGAQLKRTILLGAFLVPSIVFAIVFCLNLFLIGSHSSGAVPGGTLVAVIGLWFLVSAPLTFAGAYFGLRKPKLEAPVRTNQIPRQVPDQSFYLRPVPSVLIGGILPFVAIFLELYFILNSIWFQKFYYLFGFLFLVFIILVITCAEVTVLVCYFHLCAEDYHWWWRSFFTAGASSFYIFLYSALYYSSRLKFTSFVSSVLYFGWSFLMSFLFFIMTGTIGFYACLFFVRKIYSSIKID
ncbi:Nonaspanin [Dimargaris cristalligena]|uniref:Transmembrane 9 superfamily member n=1 Tax=Dimargaris cristalligena TaxID=215637 RepID=A0A4P9ZTU7_9FUNG|nr:Nonaspanin [Dimargaris cristalligena]|eukprot:RKP36945.1 Nonaspanin [Dimargaris cristalligena]